MSWELRPTSSELWSKRVHVGASQHTMPASTQRHTAEGGMHGACIQHLRCQHMSVQPIMQACSRHRARAEPVVSGLCWRLVAAALRLTVASELLHSSGAPPAFLGVNALAQGDNRGRAGGGKGLKELP